MRGNEEIIVTKNLCLSPTPTTLIAHYLVAYWIQKKKLYIFWKQLLYSDIR